MSGAPELPSLFLRLLKKSLLNDLHVENDAVLLAMLKASVQGQRISFDDLIGLRRSGRFDDIEAAKQEGSIISFAAPRPDGGWQPVDLVDLNHPWHTMLGRKRLDNVEFCLERVVAEAVPGDLI